MTEASPPGEPLITDRLDATLVLLRHGESTFIVEGRFQGQADTPLSPMGLRQATLAGGRLAHPASSPALPIPVRAPIEIAHSPLRRTTQTAEAAVEALREVHGAPAIRLRPDAGLAEIAQGAWEGLKREEVEARYGDILAAWRRRPLEANAPGGERVLDVAVRVRDSLRTILARLAESGRPGTLDRTHVSGYPGLAAPDTPWSLLVGHDGVFKVLLLTLLDLPLERFWTFPFALAGITIVEIQGGRPILRAHNLTEHLAPLLDVLAVAETEERERTGAL